MAPIKQWKCYRITNIPLTWSKDDLLQLLAAATPPLLLDPAEITLSPRYPTAVRAAIMFLQHSPECLRPLETQSEIPVTVLLRSGRERMLYIDVVFDGITYLNVPQEGEEIVADVIAVHGLDANPYGSWLNRDSHKMWLRDFLPERYRNIRVLSYGYNSKLVGQDLTGYTMADQKRDFVEIVASFRRRVEERNRPIIFIGHSFGGLMVLQGLLYSHDSTDKAQKRIAENTKALFLFGVPTRGLAAVDHLSKAISDLPTQYRATKNALVNNFLQKNSNSLRTMIERISQLQREYQYQVFSYYEGENTRVKRRNPRTGVWERGGEGVKLVDKASAWLGLDGEVLTCIPRDHSEMVKFESETDPHYLKVASSIGECLEKIKQSKS